MLKSLKSYSSTRHQSQSNDRGTKIGTQVIRFSLAVVSHLDRVCEDLHFNNTNTNLTLKARIKLSSVTIAEHTPKVR